MGLDDLLQGQLYLHTFYIFKVSEGISVSIFRVPWNGGTSTHSRKKPEYSCTRSFVLMACITSYQSSAYKVPTAK
jgi:hypothetical protein